MLLRALLSPLSLVMDRARVTSCVHCIWLAVIHSCPGHSLIHLSRFVKLFFRALRHSGSRFLSVNLMFFSTSQSQASTGPSSRTTLMNSTYSPSVEDIPAASHFMFIPCCKGKRRKSCYSASYNLFVLKKKTDPNKESKHLWRKNFSTMFHIFLKK